MHCNLAPKKGKLHDPHRQSAERCYRDDSDYSESLKWLIRVDWKTLGLLILAKAELFLENVLEKNAGLVLS
jgi:hypothetical protein